MKRVNYKGFDILGGINRSGNLYIDNVEASMTNQIALLTQALINDNKIVSDYEVELDYKVDFEGLSGRSEGVDIAIDIDKWLYTGLLKREKILIELLLLEQFEILNLMEIV